MGCAHARKLIGEGRGSVGKSQSISNISTYIRLDTGIKKGSIIKMWKNVIFPPYVRLRGRRVGRKKEENTQYDPSRSPINKWLTRCKRRNLYLGVRRVLRSTSNATVIGQSGAYVSPLNSERRKKAELAKYSKHKTGELRLQNIATTFGREEFFGTVRGPSSELDYSSSVHTVCKHGNVVELSRKIHA